MLLEHVFSDIFAYEIPKVCTQFTDAFTVFMYHLCTYLINLFTFLFLAFYVLSFTFNVRVVVSAIWVAVFKVGVVATTTKV